LVRVPLRAAIWADDDNCGTKIFDEMPTGPSDGENVRVCTDVAEYLKGGVVLKE